ncbi:MAG: amidohydrolase [Flavobacterium sp. BFFFF2]|nr:MAG: amidohydrolase [Flavobacterium sp. BFFFF2]
MPFTIALLSFDLVWEQPAANRLYLDTQLEALPAGVDLVVLPEMFSTGFSMNPEKIAELHQDSETLGWMQDWANKKSIAITGSLAIKDQGQFYNRLYFVEPLNVVHHYDKRHLFGFAGENKVYTPGADRLVVSYKGVKICPLICYDLRFPVFSRNTENFDLLLYVANWPKVRISVWDALLRARAIENQCFVIGVNRTGFDGSGWEFSGHTQAIDMAGNYLLSPQQTKGCFVVELDLMARNNFLQQFPFLKDQDAFQWTDK